MSERTMHRRAALELVGAVGVLVGCGSVTANSAAGGNGAGSGGNGGGSGGAAGTGGSTGSGAACKAIPAETEGPYPDKTGMLANATFERQDIREGRAGLPLALKLRVVSASQACAAVAGALVMVWHCDADGHYSEYSQMGYDGSGKTFLRGYQKTDASGQVTFTTIFPGWYAGRATHIHVEVYQNGNSLRATQLAFPEDYAKQVFSHDPYAARGNNPTTNAGDMVFGDGVADELATMSGDPASAATAAPTITIP